MITNYSDYQISKILESLICESKLEFSKSFRNILMSMKSNRLAKELLDLDITDSDIKFTQNYIDTSPEKDTVTFIQSRKADEILGKQPPKWITLESVNSKYFTLNKNDQGEFRNKHLFDALGWEPKGTWTPEAGVIGTIKAETISNKSGKTAVLFVADSGEEAVINKEALMPHNDSYEKLWTTSRNPIKVGRLTKSILTAAGIETSDKEIENFVNDYKSTFDILNDAFSKFKLVKGKDIAYWYNYKNYESQSSTLGNSCMKNVDEEFFNIYVLNPEQCSLLILFSNNGDIINGEYVSNKIKGRAIIWKTEEGDIFMDRIYTNQDSDVALFKQYAESKGWWFRIQYSGSYISVSNGKSQKQTDYIVRLQNSEFEYYPYLDTLFYLNVDSNSLSNSPSLIDAQFELDSTDGYAEEL